ncbi:hypothetical protein FRC17_006698 [Serendipita sp. 399]|nr:hypothetical protein FRC17_006698 [Serendipita sp. 399]
MGKTLIVDDADPTAGIVYTGDWQRLAMVSEQTEEFGASVHRSGSAGDTIEFTFQGVRISVYGTLDTPGTKGYPDASFTIDNGTPAGFNNTGTAVNAKPNRVSSHILYYQSELLSPGTHTIKATSNGGNAFNFDFFVVDTGRDDFTTTAGATGNVIVDDSDLSIQYAVSWKPQGVPQEYLGTTHQSPPRATGGNASFEFMGSAIAVYGTTDSKRENWGPTRMLFFIDGEDTPTIFNGIPDTAPTFHIPAFTRSGLRPNKLHTLVMVSGNQAPFFLDYLVYTLGPSSGGGAIGNNNNDPIVTVNGGGGGSPTTGPSISNSDGDSKSSSSGAVIGGVIGGFAAFFLLLLAGLWWWRRRRNNRSRFSSHNHAKIGDDDDPDELRMLEAHPFSVINTTVVPPPPPALMTPQIRQPGPISKHGFGTVRWNADFDDRPPPERSEYATPTDVYPQYQYQQGSTPVRETPGQSTPLEYTHANVVRGDAPVYEGDGGGYYSSNEKARYGEPSSPFTPRQQQQSSTSHLHPIQGQDNRVQQAQGQGHRPSASVATTSAMTASTIALTRLTGSDYDEKDDNSNSGAVAEDSGLRIPSVLPPRYTAD